MKRDLLRHHIDEIDEMFLDLLKERFRLAQKIGELKRIRRQPVEDKKREREIIKKVQTRAKELHLSKSCIKKIFTLILTFSKKEQGNV